MKLGAHVKTSCLILGSNPKHEIRNPKEIQSTVRIQPIEVRGCGQPQIEQIDANQKRNGRMIWRQNEFISANGSTTGKSSYEGSGFLILFLSFCRKIILPS